MSETPVNQLYKSELVARIDLNEALDRIKTAGWTLVSILPHSFMKEHGGERSAMRVEQYLIVFLAEEKV